MAFVRTALVAFLVYYGCFKLTYFESEAIRPLVTHSPILGWMYDVWDGRVVSAILGGVELLTAALVTTRIWSPFYGLLGSVLACCIFATTLSFLVTTPDVWTVVPQFPLPVPDATASFILKDVFLLGISGMSAFEARKAMSLA
jgi:uncharacterized membrane protein YkgB